MSDFNISYRRLKLNKVLKYGSDFRDVQKVSSQEGKMQAKVMGQLESCTVYVDVVCVWWWGAGARQVAFLTTNVGGVEPEHISLDM